MAENGPIIRCEVRSPGDCFARYSKPTSSRCPFLERLDRRSGSTPWTATDNLERVIPNGHLTEDDVASVSDEFASK